MCPKKTQILKLIMKNKTDMITLDFSIDSNAMQSCTPELGDLSNRLSGANEPQLIPEESGHESYSRTIRVRAVRAT